MAGQFETSVAQRVTQTTNTPEGIRNALVDIEENLNAIDLLLSDLLAERTVIASFVGHLADMYRLMTGEFPLPEQHLENMQSPPNPVRSGALRLKVLKIAMDIAPEPGGVVRDSDVLAVLEKMNPDSPTPWSNPPAVIATILNRSGEFTKKDSGVYERTAESVPEVVQSGVE